MNMKSVVIGVLAIALLGCATGASCAGTKKTVALHTRLDGKDLSRTTAAVNDQPGHEIMQRVYSYRVTSEDADFDGITTDNFAQTDSVDGSGTHRGYGVWHTRSGDRITARFEGEHHAGAAGSSDFTGKVTITGGTGRFAAISGSGTYRGRTTPDGQTSDATLEVTY